MWKKSHKSLVLSILHLNYLNLLAAKHLNMYYVFIYQMLSMCQSVKGIEDTKVNKAGILYRGYILIKEMGNLQI